MQTKKSQEICGVADAMPRRARMVTAKNARMLSFCSCALMWGLSTSGEFYIPIHRLDYGSGLTGPGTPDGRIGCFDVLTLV